MAISELIEQLRQQLPKASHRRVACLAMLICDRDPELACLANNNEFVDLLEEIQLRMQSIDDQHAAVANELDQLALTQPCEFEPKHVWTLIRAIKAQSQFVDMFTGACTVQTSMP